MTSSVLVYEKERARSMANEVIERSGQNIFACYQCRRCAAGCPVSEETGMTPDRLIRLIIMGDRDAALKNQLVWQCVSCYTCGTRCPNEIHTARITETLKKMAKEDHLPALSPKIKTFHSAFCTAAKHKGRVNEMEFMGRYEMSHTFHQLSRFHLKGVYDEFKNQAKMGLAMTKKKRMHFSVEKVKDRSELKRLFKLAKKKKAVQK
ncbi:MAG: 4Fe-4S dicluster domain-containing protein [Deltaproteobacteria bacterium]|jgi:heterodisulfide reductase subunit C2